MNKTFVSKENVMRNSLFVGFIALVLSLGISQNSYADCPFAGPTGTGGNILNCVLPVLGTPIIPGAAGNDNESTAMGDEINIPLDAGVIVSAGTPAIDTDLGADVVNISGNIINDMGDGLTTRGGEDTVVVNTGANISGFIGIQTEDDADMVTINGGTITGTTIRALGTGAGNDFVVINGGTFTGVVQTIRTTADDDTLRIFGGTFNGAPIAGGTGADNILIAGGTFNGNGINGDAGNDTINIAADISDLGDIDCGGGAANTLIFSMDVPLVFIPQLSDEIANAGPTGSIMINGNTYSWTDCEILVNNLNGFVTTVTLTPVFAVNNLFTDHTVTATVETDGVSVVGEVVEFEITSGPNLGLISPADGTCSPNPDCTTDANGQVSWTYTGSGGGGTDVIFADFFANNIDTRSNAAEKQWVANVPTLSEWGLIAMAALLGIAAFIYMRRRQVSA